MNKFLIVANTDKDINLKLSQDIVAYITKKGATAVVVSDIEAHYDKAVIRPEFIKISKSGNLNRYMSAAEEGIITDVVFRGNRVDVTVNINGIEVVGERSLEKDLVSVGETVHVLIYRLYIFDEHKTYLMENSEMQEQDVFYI